MLLLPSTKGIAAIFTPLVSRQEPGLAVLVRLNGRTLFKRGYGSRDLRSGAAIDAHSNFRLASCTKQFTAMAVMLLIHDGKLRLDEKLIDVFPDFPPYGRTVTIRNLLNHTSGLVAYEDLMDKTYAGKLWQEIPQISDAGVLELMEQQALTPVEMPGGFRSSSESAAGASIKYGFGWFLDPYHGHARMWHYGESIGFRSVIERFPADRLTIIILANRTDLDPSSLALKVADIFLH